MNEKLKKFTKRKRRLLLKKPLDIIIKKVLESL